MTSSDVASFEECHLIWTSWKKQPIIDELLKLDEYEEQFKIGNSEK
jgi:hypothetical protein